MATNPTTIKPTIPSAKFEPEIKAGATVKAMTAAEAKGTKGDAFIVPLAAIKVMDGFNVRVTGTPSSEEAMAELVQSIRANGFYPDKPLSGFVLADGDANDIYVKDGHRRLEAVSRINAEITAANAVEGAEQQPLIEALPVIARPAGSLEDMTVEMAQSNTGAPLTMYEKGLLAKRLLGYNMTKEDVAAKLSMTERHLNNVLLLAEAPAKLRDLIVSDKVTATSGLKLMRDPKTAAAKAADMVKAADAKGKARANKSDTASGPKMQSVVTPFEFKKGDDLKGILKQIAGRIRELVGHEVGESEDAISTALGSIRVAVNTPAPEPAPKPAAAPKPPKAAAAPKAEAAPKMTAAQAKAAAQAHLGGDGTKKAPAKKPAAKKADAAPAPAEDPSGL